MYFDCKNHSDQAKCVNSLVERCRALQRRLGPLGLPSSDTRVVALRNIENVGIATILKLNLLDSWALGDATVKAIIPQFLGLTTVTKEAVDQAGNAIQKTTKLALLLLAQFQIENCMANILGALGEEPPKGFYRLARSLCVNELGLGQTFADRLNVSALIRNSLHSNGIHHALGGLPRQWYCTIEPVDYEFIDGQPVRCASVEHVSHALETSVDGLATILTHSRVTALPSPIADGYAVAYEEGRAGPNP